MSDKHRHTSSVLGFEKHLLDDVVIGIKRHVGCTEDTYVASRDIKTIDCRRRIETAVGEERFRITSATTKTDGRANAREIDVADCVTGQ